VGACICHGVTITSKALIGAGATVSRNLEGAGTYVGTPARKIV
jgi:acetyltransferase-like isoleucine patch superfamily enzyme